MMRGRTSLKAILLTLAVAGYGKPALAQTALDNFSRGAGAFRDSVQGAQGLNGLLGNGQGAPAQQAPAQRQSPPPAAHQPASPSANKPASPPKPAVSSADREACSQSAQGKNLDRAIQGCNAIIGNRAKENKANVAAAYDSRAAVYNAQGKPDQAISDLNQAIQIKPEAGFYVNRATAYSAKSDQDKAIADLTQAIALQPENAEAYSVRANAYIKKGQLDQAIADSGLAISLKPELAQAYESRGRAHFMKDDQESALADLNQAIALKPTLAESHALRGMIYEKQGDAGKAASDFGAALAAPATTADGKQMQAQVRQRLASLAANASTTKSIQDKAKQEQLAAVEAEKQKREELERRLAALESRKSSGGDAGAGSGADSFSASAPFNPGRRVALIIGNSAYQGFAPLKNPLNDGKDVAAAFRRLGFVEVMEVYDANRAKMEEALKEFGDKTADADWAVVFYSGHGIQVDGQNYLIPIDAKLMRSKHVEDETISLDRLRDKVHDAKELRLVMLDACRNNPFQSRMVSDSGQKRAIGRGLGRIEASAGELVAFATKEGNVADDGNTRNSPFTRALLGHIENPGLELNMLLRKVHDSVLKETGNAQEPYTYGALPGSALYFKPAAAPAASASAGK